MASVGGTLLWLWLLRGRDVQQTNRLLIRGGALLTVPLFIIFLLLSSTPPNAIRLSGRLSRGIILVVTGMFQLMAVAVSGDVAAFRASALERAFHVAAAAAIVVAAGLLISLLNARRHSAWWAVLFCWNPLVVIGCGGMGHVEIIGDLVLILFGLWFVGRG